MKVSPHSSPPLQATATARQGRRVANTVEYAGGSGGSFFRLSSFLVSCAMAVCRSCLGLSYRYLEPFALVSYRKNFYDSPSQEEVGESRLGRKSRGSETKFLEMD